MRPRIADRPRRHYRRCTVRVMVDYACGRERRTDPATTLGAGGLFIETRSPLPAGSELSMCFRVLEDGASHELTGRVVWCRAPRASDGHASGMGIEFTDREAAVALALELELERL